MIVSAFPKVKYPSFDVSIPLSVINLAFRDAQTYITVKENTLPKIVAILKKISESVRMLELAEMLA